jgi:O-antigen/teichoic acid export membrane protein
MLGVQLANLGLFSSSIYYLAREPALLRTLLGNSLAASAILGGVAIVVALLIESLTPVEILPGGLVEALALAWIPVGLVQLFLQSLLLGLQDIRGYNICDVGIRLATALATAVVLATAHASVAALLGAAIWGMLVGAVIAYRRARPQMDGPPAFSWSILRRHLPYGSRAYVTTLFGYIVMRADVLVIQYSLGARDTGLYSVALTITDSLYTLPVVIAAVLFPRLAAVPDLGRKWRLTWTLTLMGTSVMAVGILAIAILARPLVSALFGQEFLQAAQLLQLLLPGLLFLSIETMIVQYLNARGFPVQVAWVWIGIAIVKCFLLVALVPQLGASAAAVVSSSISFLLLIAICLLVFVDLRKEGRWPGAEQPQAQP